MIVRAALAILLYASIAQAQSEADALFTSGVEHLRAEEFAEAATAFRESYRLDPNVTTMCNLALTYDRWGRDHREQAVRAYRTCAQDDNEGRFREHAAARSVELERELALEEHVERPPEPPVAPPPPPPPYDHGFLFATIAPGVLAAGALITGIALALDAQQTVSALMQELGPSPMIVRGSPEEAQLMDAESKATWANVFYVTSAVSAVGGLALLVIDLVLAEEHPVVIPAVVPHAGGLELGIRAAF